MYLYLDFAEKCYSVYEIIKCSLNIAYVDECPGGYTSDTGVSPCAVVPANSYWVDAKTHVPCPSGTANPQPGGKDVNACRGESQDSFRNLS